MNAISGSDLLSRKTNISEEAVRLQSQVDTAAQRSPPRPFLLAEGIRARWRRCFPPTAYDPFLVIASVSMALMALGAPLKRFLPIMSAGPWDWIGFVGDAAILNTFGFAACAYLVYTGLDFKSPYEQVSMATRRFCALAVPAAITAYGIFLDIAFVNGSFESEAATVHLRESWLTDALNRIVAVPLLAFLHRPPASVNSPSTSWLLACLYLCAGLAFSRHMRHRHHERVRFKKLTRWEKRALRALFVTCFLTATVRVLRGFDNPSDIAIGLGVSCYSFWVLDFVIGKLLQKSHPAAMSGLVSMTLLYLPIFMYASRNATAWIVAFAVIVALLGAIKIFTTESTPKLEPEIYQDSLMEVTNTDPP